MAVQQLTQPILNPIAAFDATKEQTISFVVIGGAQVVANRLVIQDNQTGVEIYSNIESTLKLEHTIPANTLKNGGYYNAVVYTLDNSNTLSSPSTPVPFYCYTQPLLTITNIPATETIENGTYTFEGSYSQIEGELLNSYQFTLYDSNKEVLSQTPLIYYETDSSLSYTFVGMNNDTSYYIELSGQTLNNTSMSTGLLYFTVRYIQPASFAICDLVNDCKDGYVQISSNIVAIDGHSNPDPPIYIDDKEVDLRDPDSYVEWNSGFRIQDDFTMRAWGRDFNDYQNIITLTNDINTEETPNKIELKWMLGDVVKEQLSYEDINGELINVSDSVTAPIKNLEIYGNSIQVDRNADVYVEGKSTQEVQATSFKTATGNPVTITDGELDKPVKLGQIDGLSTQATRNGKNYFDASKIANTNIVVSDNGQTITMPIATSGNGYTTTNKKLSELCPNLKVGDTVYLYGNTTSNLNKYIYIGSLWHYNTERTITQADLDATVILYGNRYQDGETEQVIISNLMITKENDNTWEQYGASPSPEFPSEIQSVGDDVDLAPKINNTNYVGVYPNSTIYVDNEVSFDLSAGAGAGVSSIPINVKDLKTISLSAYLKSSDSNTKIALRIYKQDGTTVLSYGYQGTITTDYKRYIINDIDVSNEEVVIIKLLRATDTGIASMKNIKLQKGTVATPYSEYGKGTVTIEQRGKNLYNYKDTVLVTNSTVDDEGWITVTYDNTEGTNPVFANYFTNNLKLKSSTQYSIIIEVKNKSGSGSLFYTTTYSKNEGQFSSTKYLSFNALKSINIMKETSKSNPDDMKYGLRSYVKFNAGQSGSITFRISVLEDTTVTADDFVYEPYFSKDYVIQTTPLRSLPNGTKDTIEEGTHRKVGSKIFDGSDDEGWVLANIDKLRYPFGIDISDAKLTPNNAGMINLLSNQFIASLSSEEEEAEQDKSTLRKTNYNQRFWFFVPKKYFTGTTSSEILNEFKEMLSENPIIVQYELAEEVVEPFTEDQKEVLNSITTQSGTNIFDAQTNMELKYNYNYEIPSPEVESPIKSVGDDVNLCYLSEVHNSVELWCHAKSKDINTKELTLSFQTNVSLNKNSLYLKIDGQDAPNPRVGIVTGNAKELISVSFSLSDENYNAIKNGTDIVFNIYKANAGFTEITNAKLQKGTVATPYSEYGKGTVTIEQRGKNLWTLNSSYTTTTGSEYVLRDTTIKTIPAGTYTLSLKKSVNSNVLFTFKDSSNKQTNIYLNGAEQKTINFESDIIKVAIYIYGNQACTISNVQIEEGTEATDYEPYFSKDYVIPLSEPLRSLPKGTKDILNNKGITRKVGKIVLNGSEHWTGFVSSYKNTIRAQTMISDMSNMGGKADLNIMSSHFLPKDLYGHDIVGIEHIYNELFIRINKYDLDEISLNGFKAWLAAHPTEVIYELATAQNESYEGQTPSPDTPSPIISVGDVKNLIDVPDFNIDYNQQYYQNTNTNFLLKPNYTYTLSFDFNINKSSTDLYYSLGYGTDIYAKDITKTTIYSTQTKGRNEITFTVPADIPDNSYLWVRFARTIILADINVDISNIQLEKGKEDTGYQPTTDYNIYLTVSSKNLFDYDNPLYIRTNNLNYNEISNGYHMSPISVGENTEFTIGIENCFNEGDIYALSFSQLGEFGYVAMYKTLKGTQERVNIIDLNNNIFTAPSQNYDLELVFSMSSSALSNSLEIWSIQIEANNTQTTYETHEENSSIITLDTPLNRIGDYADWVGNISPNLLNPVTGSAIVEENTDYFYNKKSTYTASVTIQYKNADGNVISSETLTNDSTISTPENCVEIHIEGLNEQAIKTNHLQIRKGNSNKPYLPYITEPSLIKVTGKIVLDGSSDEKWGSLNSAVNTYKLSGFVNGNGTDNSVNYPILSNYFKSIAQVKVFNGVKGTIQALGGNVNSLYICFGKDSTVNSIQNLSTWLSTHNTEVIYVLEEPKIIPLSSLNSEALKALETYEPISNVYTNNKLLGTLDLDYANGKDMKEVQNAYVLLKCWNGNKMPYVIHSNYIDIPESTENIFIWMRRKKNIFDLRIENLTKGD